MSRRNTRRTRARIDELAEELAIGAAIRLRCDSDDIRHVVNAVVAYLIEEYPAQDLYIPAAVSWPVDEIRRAVERGDSMREICRRHRIDRRTVYRLLDAEADLT